jgi:hypothetical protein
VLVDVTSIGVDVNESSHNPGRSAIIKNSNAQFITCTSTLNISHLPRHVKGLFIPPE